MQATGGVLSSTSVPVKMYTKDFTELMLHHKHFTVHSA